MTTSPQAQVSKFCKQYIKSIGLTCRTKSSSFAGGNSVDVFLTDIPPTVIASIKAEFEQYESGYFNAYKDIYEYKSNQSNVPTVKYLTVNNQFSDNTVNKAWSFLRGLYPANAELLPVDLNEAKYKKWCKNDYHDIGHLVYGLLCGEGLFGQRQNDSKQFWANN